jgi:ABC-type transport system substrate-binding protein
MYDTMLRLTPEGLKPGLATAWSFPDASTVELTIRKGVKFQDGTPLDAAAVKFSWERIIATPATPSGAKDGSMTKVAGIAAMQSVELVGTDGVRLRLKSPVAGDFRDRYLFEAASGLSPVSPTAVKAMGDGIRNGVPANAGAGPYKLTEYIPGQKISLRKWDGYWDPGSVKLGGVDFIQVSAGAPTITALTSGTVDLIQPAGADAKGVAAQGFDVKAYVSNINTDWMTFCTTQPPMDKLAVRQAIAYALNRKDFLDTAYFGYGEASSSFLATTSQFYDKAYKDPYPQDIAKAKSLLASAGVPAGTKIVFLTSTTPLDAAFAQVMQTQLKAIGLELEIQQTANPFADLFRVKPAIQRTAGAIRTAVSAYITTGGVGNPCGYDNPTVTAALVATRNTSATDAQLKTAWNAFDKAAADEVALITVVKPASLTATSKKVKGIEGNYDLINFFPAAMASISITK